MIRNSLLLLTATTIFSCAGDKDKATSEPVKLELKEEAVIYKEDTTSMDGYVVYNAALEGKRPVVMVVHEWWGNNVYPKSRAKQLAEMGYLAMAVDLYGNGATAEDPVTAGNMAMPFYKDPEMGLKRFEAALAKIKTYPQADTSRIAAIGYCFGGAQVLNYARMGENLKGVVSFHGNLTTTPLIKEKLKAAVLVCHGGSDQFVPENEVAQFRREMDSVKADYTFKSYAGATHAFTNKNATAVGQKFNIPIAYNAVADSTSWEDMKLFFNKIFK